MTASHSYQMQSSLQYHIYLDEQNHFMEINVAADYSRNSSTILVTSAEGPKKQASLKVVAINHFPSESLVAKNPTTSALETQK